MNGARFIHDELAAHGWEVLVADAQKVKGWRPLACKTDKVDSRVLGELSFRDLMPAIWLPDPQLRGARERSRVRLHLVKHRTSLKNRIHSTLMAFGHQRPVSDLFGVTGRKLLDNLDMPEPWRGHIDASLLLIRVLHLSAGQMRRRPTTDHRGGLRHGRSSGSPSRLAGRTRLSGGGGSKLRRPELGLTTSERYVRGVACSACSSSR